MKKVLVVDDLRTVRSILKIKLQSLGYEVEEAENGKRALELIQKNSDYNLVITDIEMPVMSGLELLEELKQRGLDLNLAIASSKADSFSEDELSRLNVLRAYKKPVSIEQLSFLSKLI